MREWIFCSKPNCVAFSPQVPRNPAWSWYTCPCISQYITLPLKLVSYQKTSITRRRSNSKVSPKQCPRWTGREVSEKWGKAALCLARGGKDQSAWLRAHCGQGFALQGSVQSCHSPFHKEGHRDIKVMPKAKQNLLPPPPARPTLICWEITESSYYLPEHMMSSFVLLAARGLFFVLLAASSPPDFKFSHSSQGKWWFFFKLFWSDTNDLCIVQTTSLGAKLVQVLTCYKTGDWK